MKISIKKTKHFCVCDTERSMTKREDSKEGSHSGCFSWCLERIPTTTNMRSSLLFVAVCVDTYLELRRMKYVIVHPKGIAACIVYTFCLIHILNIASKESAYFVYPVTASGCKHQSLRSKVTRPPPLYPDQLSERESKIIIMWLCVCV
jgi:hypothetical protein